MHPLNNINIETFIREGENVCPWMLYFLRELSLHRGSWKIIMGCVCELSRLGSYGGWQFWNCCRLLVTVALGIYWMILSHFFLWMRQGTNTILKESHIGLAYCSFAYLPDLLYLRAKLDSSVISLANSPKDLPSASSSPHTSNAHFSIPFVKCPNDSAKR